MLDYDKTALGQEALQGRSIQLNARQRRLLVLIGSDDFALLNDTIRQRFAPPELLEQLLDLGLISTNHPTQDQPHEIQDNQTSSAFDDLLPSFKKAVSATENLLQKIIEPKATLERTPLPNPTPKHEHQLTVRQAYSVQSTDGQVYDVEAQTIETLTVLSFEDVKFVMMQTLHQHCGLMARQLIQKIRHAPDLKSLKLCQMQWLTHLQETRIASKELNKILRQINFSLNN